MSQHTEKLYVSPEAPCVSIDSLTDEISSDPTKYVIAQEQAISELKRIREKFISKEKKIDWLIKSLIDSRVLISGL